MTTVEFQYVVRGMDCADCAAKIEKAVRALEGVKDVRVSIASQRMTVRMVESTNVSQKLERLVGDLGYQLGRADVPTASQTSPAYKRALWIVVLLNLGYGAVEIAGGFIAGSQSLKADALDFVGDGALSLLGLAAVGWGLRARAIAVLLQGLFLGALGAGVLGTTVYRIFALNQPQAELMGVFGAVGLVVNVGAAVALIPHRKGDANVRAVWLFSRNDAIGNAAVIIAAALVWWTSTPWPDLVVAVAVSALFLHSADSIISHARADLRRP